MKNINTIMVVAALAGVVSFASAEPKGAAYLRETKMVKGTPAATFSTVGEQAAERDGIAATPRGRQLLNEQSLAANTRSTTVTPAATVASVQGGTDDGIAASPKHRQYLNEHRSQFMVAPLK